MPQNTIRYKKHRVFALKKIGFGVIVCVRCGCNDERLLEVNHKNGGGSQEHKKSIYSNFIHAIAVGRRKTEDLEILCRPCNAIHYLEKKYGKLPLRVIFNP